MSDAWPPADDPACLEIPPNEMRAMADRVVGLVVDHLAHLGDHATLGDTSIDDLRDDIRRPAPDAPRAIDDALGPFFDAWVQRTYGTAHPGYLAFIPGGGLFASALADFVASATNRYTGVHLASPALVELEAVALDWLREWMGFPPDARGLFTSGGSLANFSAIVAAREKLLGTALRDGTMYCSSQVHHCVTKSAQLAGILPDRVRTIDVDERFAMDVDALAAAIDADRAAGLRPFLVVSSAGTTNTGAVDPMPAIGALCRERGLWHHVDGAYGAFFHMVPELRSRLPGLSDADSLTLDPHKGLFLPYGTGALIVRDGEDLRLAHAATAGYLPPPGDAERYDPSQYGPELSRPYRGLRVWLCVQVYGLARLRAAVAEKHALAQRAAAELSQVEGLVIDAPPALSLFPFHVHAPGWTQEDDDAATRALVERVNARGRVMITGCTAGGRFLARICVLSFRTRPGQIDEAIADVTAEVGALTAPV